MALDANVENAVLEILERAILRIRSAAWKGNAERCAIEADHVHNLPSLLQMKEFDLVKFYWNTERPAFIHQLTGHCEKTGISADLEQFKKFWTVIEAAIKDL